MKDNKKIKKSSCFVIMPFDDWFDEYYENIYKPAIEASGLIPKRSDDLCRPSSVVGDIWDYTKEAKIILAELTGKNPNVFYELGLAHAIKKPAILITQSIEDVPFDLRSLRVVEYDKNDPNWGGLLKENIKQAISEINNSPEKSIPPTFIDDFNEKKKTNNKMTKEQKLKSRIIQLEHEKERLIHQNRISPLEAEERIKNYLGIGMPKSLIINRMERIGIPPRWAEGRIDALVKNKKIKIRNSRFHE